MLTVRKLTAVAVAVMALLAAAGARAAVIPAVPAPALTTTVSGTLEYVKNLESPHYQVGGWVINAPDFAVLSLLTGKQVTVSGRPMDGVSFLMRRQLIVTSMTTTLEGSLEASDGQYLLAGFALRGLEGQVQAQDGARVRVVGSVVWRSKGPPTLDVIGFLPLAEPAVSRVSGPLKQRDDGQYAVEGWALQYAHPQWLARLTGQPVTVVGTEVTGSAAPTLKVVELQVSLTGLLTHVTDMETPHWQLHGFVLAGLPADLMAYTDGPVTVQGAVLSQASIYMRPVIQVAKVAAAPLPGQVTVRGKAVALPVPAAMADGALMLPLRAVIEAAGGQVTWDPALWGVRVQVGSQVTIIRIGSRAAGSVELSAAPVLQGGHTLAPLDLFTAVGLDARWIGPDLHLQ